MPSLFGLLLLTPIASRYPTIVISATAQGMTMKVWIASPNSGKTSWAADAVSVIDGYVYGFALEQANLPLRTPGAGRSSGGGHTPADEFAFGPDLIHRRPPKESRYVKDSNFSNRGRTIGVNQAPAQQITELRRQTDLLVRKGYPALAGITEEKFRALIAPLELGLPVETPSILVVTGMLVPVTQLVGRTALNDKRGFTTMEVEDILKFRPSADVAVPDVAVYLITDVDTGGETLNVRPDEARPLILAAHRTPLTLEEGLAVVTHHPEWLLTRNCFEMLGSSASDRRVTGMWVSKGAPRLGWCWLGNPHTWLGAASAARRIS